MDIYIYIYINMSICVIDILTLLHIDLSKVLLVQVHVSKSCNQNQNGRCILIQCTYKKQDVLKALRSATQSGENESETGKHLWGFYSCRIQFLLVFIVGFSCQTPQNDTGRFQLLDCGHLMDEDEDKRCAFSALRNFCLQL